jgi:hypothetical protein
MEHNIEVASFSEEIRAWTRRINFDFDGKRVYVRLYWDEGGNGYEFTDPDFEGEGWTDEARLEVYDWLRDTDENGEPNLAVLDELTSDIITPKEG